MIVNGQDFRNRIQAVMVERIGKDVQPPRTAPYSCDGKDN
jgi:hypothetical protein